ncbi:hypothetical protein BJ165DRAFT_857734 [Panaeolus papilionaceus]|nr:hypothetical protein BJ165DRAFT_857734 [Panaeolus papilionaceus]
MYPLMEELCRAWKLKDDVDASILFVLLSFYLTYIPTLVWHAIGRWRSDCDFCLYCCCGWASALACISHYFRSFGA